MSDSDDMQDRADTPRSPERDIPAGDFSRKRVADILRREKPMQDQQNAALRLVRALSRMFDEVRGTTFGAVYLKKGRIITYNLAKNARPFEVIWMGHKPVPAIWLHQPANFQSKFFRLSQPAIDSAAVSRPGHIERRCDRDGPVLPAQ